MATCLPSPAPRTHPHARVSFVYDEPTCTLTAAELAQLLPSYNNRIVLHSRRFAPPESDTLEAVIGIAGVVGVAFEANPTGTFVSEFNIPAGAAYVRSRGLPCFLLSPPGPGTTNYTQVCARVRACVCGRG